MNGKVEPSLTKDERGCFEASLVNFNTGERSLPCVITGYPVLHPTEAMTFNNNTLMANTEDWNKFLMASRVFVFKI
jgi:intraflagellar transport protein 172